MNLKIIVDSSSDLPADIVKKYDISVIPLRVYDQLEKEFLDGVNIQSHELMQRMKNGENFTSSLPSYDAIYQTLISCSTDQNCVYLTCSGDLSGTYNFAQLVKLDILENNPNASIHIIDTRSVSLGICVLVLELIEDLNNNESFENLMNQLNHNINKIQHIFTIEDLQYLIRGGRVGKFAGFLGGMLNINPIMEVSEGKFKPLEKVRGRKKALNRMLELIKIRKDELSKNIGVVYGVKDDSTEQFIKQLKDLIGSEQIIENSVGSAVGVHTGPSAIGIFFLAK
ncbi:DegV family protein [Gottfriedia acidiceleris]|uniref:DegV family protein n=1 Tax=Gottfriedia acidiceleris TaxID=371036 RepID=A0ABY4JFM3_9BACI|nr:DegV family protein [Gottfriedia acidiceleris]UPM52631.1 DegV family protein [Gottfriedia acidiceleris]